MSGLTPATLGVILAGGLARRLGGGDKGMREVGGRAMLERVIARLRPQCETLVLSANGDPARFAFLGVPVVADAFEAGAGPLAGVLAGFDWAAANRPDLVWAVTAPADCPFAPRDLVARLHAAREAEGADLAVAGSGGRAHPAIGLWGLAQREQLRHALVVENCRKVSRWTARHSLAVASWPDAPSDPFFNVNTPEDLAAADRLAALEDD